MSVRLRPASADDAERLWAWANDADVRHNAFATEPIPWSAHVSWLSSRLGSPDCRIWIAEEGGQPIGQVRVDREGPRGTLDYSVGREFRGRGLGAAILRAAAADACAALRVASLVGVVKTSNVSSCRTFERAGFRLAGAVTRSAVDCRVYEWPCRSAGA